MRGPVGRKFLFSIVFPHVYHFSCLHSALISHFSLMWGPRGGSGGRGGGGEGIEARRKEGRGGER